MSGRMRGVSAVAVLLPAALAACVAAAFAGPSSASRPALSTTSAPALDPATRTRLMNEWLTKATELTERVVESACRISLFERIGTVWLAAGDTVAVRLLIKRQKDTVPALEYGGFYQYRTIAATEMSLGDTEVARKTLELALPLARGKETEDDRDRAYLGLANDYLDLGDTRMATRLVFDIAGPRTRCDGHLCLAEAYERAGHRVAARLAAFDALAAARSDSEDYYRQSNTVRVAEQLAAVGANAEARDLVAESDDPCRRSDDYRSLARVHTRRGDTAAAQTDLALASQSTDTVETPSDRHQLHSLIAEECMSSSDTAGYRRAVEAMSRAAEMEEDEKERRQLNYYTAWTCLMCQDTPTARAFIDRLVQNAREQNGSRWPILAAGFYAQCGDLSAAEAVVDSIEDKDAREQARVNIFHGTLFSRGAVAAEDYRKKGVPVQMDDRRWCDYATGLAEDGRFDDARREAAAITSAWSRTTAYRNIASLQFRKFRKLEDGRKTLKLVEEAIEGINLPENRRGQRMALVPYYLILDDMPRVRAVAKEADNAELDGLIILVEVRRGRIAETVEWIENDMHSPDRRARAYIDAAWGLFPSQEPFEFTSDDFVEQRIRIEAYKGTHGR